MEIENASSFYITFQVLLSQLWFNISGGSCETQSEDLVFTQFMLEYQNEIVMSFKEIQAIVEGFSVKFHLPPAGVSLPRSFHTGQLHAGQCQLWSVCWCRCLPGSTVWQPRQREEGRESEQGKEVGSVVWGDGERREWNSEKNQCEKLQRGENQEVRGRGSEIEVPE